MRRWKVKGQDEEHKPLAPNGLKYSLAKVTNVKADHRHLDTLHVASQVNGCCHMQLSNSIHYIFVTSGYQSKQPVLCSLVHELNHLAVCDMMSDPPSFIMRMLDH